jgi:hypothetical protein
MMGYRGLEIPIWSEQSTCRQGRERGVEAYLLHGHQTDNVSVITLASVADLSCALSSSQDNQEQFGVCHSLRKANADPLRDPISLIQCAAVVLQNGRQMVAAP